MSGPIVRKYGFPNFEKIFGERDIKHGAEPSEPTPASSTPPEDKPEPGPGHAGPAKPDKA